MNLNKQQRNLIVNLLKQPKFKVAYSKNWQVIHQEFEIGQVDGRAKYLEFSKDDLLLLKQMSQQFFGDGLLAPSVASNRMAQAHHSRNEKWASISPEAEFVTIKPLLCQTEFKLAPDFALRVPLDAAHKFCQQWQVKQVLVVENLDCFDYIAQAILPFSSATMVIYRGSGIASPSAVKLFLSQLGDGIDVVVFADVDPAGIQIGLTTPKVSQLLLPSIIDLTSLLAQFNYQSDFDDQYKQLNFIVSCDCIEIKSWINFICEHKVSVKQQHLIANKLTLQSIGVFK